MSLLGAVTRIDGLLSFIDSVEADGGEAPVVSSQNGISSQNGQNGQNGQSAAASEGDEFKPSNGSPADRIMNALNSLSIAVLTKCHKAVLTSEEHVGVASDMPGVIVKNLFVKEKRKKTNFLVVVPADKQGINLKALGMHLGVGGGLRFVQDPTSVIEMDKGSITPLAVLFDKDKVVEVYVDESLRSANGVVVHPGANTASVCITPSDLERYIGEFGNGVNYLDLDQFIGERGVETAARLGKELQKNNSQKQPKVQKKQKKQQKQKKKNNNKQGSNAEEKENEEGITMDKNSEFGEWYKQIVTRCELIDYTDISGCYVLRPLAYSIWEKIQAFMDLEIKKLGVPNTSFPLFVSEAALNTEKKHVEDFTPEVAWVTHSGDTKLENRIAVRPTSETIMYPMFAKWIRSYHDLPLKINQWCNIVRWEFKNPTPFLRTREFLWQEGHTAYASQEEAMKEVYEVLDIYARTYSEICAVPTIKGTKTNNERFPGADETTTVEAYIPGSGRGIQGGTSHHLGQHFSNKNAFNITYLDTNNTALHPYQNSWGFTTRSIGVMIMNHSDNSGLVLPPRVAQWQVVIIAIPPKAKDQVEQKNEEIQQQMEQQAKKLSDALNAQGIRSFVDSRGKKPGYKYNEWELKGVPIRLELGTKDMEKSQVMAARRDMRDDRGRLVKSSIAWDGIEKSVADLLENIQNNLLKQAQARLEANVARCTEWQQLCDEMFKGKLVLAPHCMEDECEDRVGPMTKEYFEKLPDTVGAGQTGKAKALCIPLEESGYQPQLQDGQKCVVLGCNACAKKFILFGRSY